MTKLERLRRERGILQKDLSARSLVTVRTIRNIEKGNTEKVQKRIRGLLAVAFGLTPSDLFTKEGRAR